MTFALAIRNKLLQNCRDRKCDSTKVITDQVLSSTEKSKWVFLKFLIGNSYEKKRQKSESWLS